LDRRLHRLAPAEGLAERVDRGEPARAPAARDQSFLAQQVEGAPDGHPAGGVLPGELELAGKGASWAQVTGQEAGAQGIGEVEMLHDLYITCLLLDGQLSLR